MRLTSRLRLLTGIALCSTLLSGCIYDDLSDCPGMFYGNVRVEYHWDHAPDASPQGMACCFFPRDGGDVWVFDLPGRNGGEIKIPSGEYSFVSFNDDTSEITFSNSDDYSRMSASTSAGRLISGAVPGEVDSSQLPQLSDVAAQPVKRCPDMMWSYACGQVDIRAGNRNSVIPAHPRPIVRNYHYDITGVVNLQGVARMSGAISGMASEVILSDGSPEGEAAILPFGAMRQGADAIHGDFLTFGPAAGTGNYLFLFVWLTDGRRYVYRFDVTRQVTEAPDPMDVWLRISGLELPESHPGEAGAFDVTVDGWTTIIINLGVIKT